MSRTQEETEHHSVKFNWNVFPVTRLEESQMSTPLGVCILHSTTPMYHLKPKAYPFLAQLVKLFEPVYQIG